jgi:hypothetical protein
MTTPSDPELEAAQAEVAKSRRAAKRTMLILAALSLVLLGVGAYAAWLASDNHRLAVVNAQYGAGQEKEKKSLAQAATDTLCQSADQSAAASETCRNLEKAATEPSQGPQGVQGLQGPQGSPGPRGIDGSPGPIGQQGVQGIQGATGPKGDTGAAGVSGASGNTGTDGADSTVPGPPGPQGEPGPTGPVGPIGPAGPAGANGTNGTNGVDGKDGTSPTSFTFTDTLGTTYTCMPNPPGSSTYTCAAAQPTPAGGAP